MSESPAVPTAARPDSRGRGIAAVVCLTLAILLTTPAGIAFWGQRTLNDTQRYVDTVGPLVDSPEVQAAIATQVTATIQKKVDVESLLNQAFAGVINDRPRLQLLVGPLAGAVNGLIESQVNEFIASDAFRDLWITANTRSQQLLVKLLKGEDTGAVSVQDEGVVLDVSEVIDAVQQRLVDRGLTFVQNVPTPDQDRQIVLMEGSQFKQVRTIYALGNPVARWLILLVALLYLAAFVLSRRRPRMSVAIGLGLVANALLIALLLSVGRQLFINQLAGTVFGPASRVFYNQLLVFLERGQKAIFWLGLVVVAAGWFAGSNAPGSASRRTISTGLESVGASLAGGPVGRAGDWVAANVRWLRVVAWLVGVVVLLWGFVVTASRVGWATLLVIVLLALLQVLVGAGGGAARVTESAPPAPTPPADQEDTLVDVGAPPTV